MPETVVGAPPHPQALFLGFSADDPSYKAMSAMVATAALIDTTLGLQKRFRLQEWDIFVSRGPITPPSSPLFVPSWMHMLALGASETGWVEMRGSGEPVGLTFSDTQPSTTVTVHDDDVPDELRRLVQNELVPWLMLQDRRPHLVESHYSGLAATAPAYRSPPVVTPLVTDADGHIIAGIFDRRDHTTAGGKALVLPFVPEAPERWLAAVMEVWRVDTPHRFTDLPTWRASPRWQTAEEVAAREAIAELGRKRDQQEAALRLEEQRVEANLIAASSAADAGRRRLLTEQDKALVDAVADAFRYLGFVVLDADAETEAAGAGAAKMEDLRLTDPTDPGWTNITEVKGYKAGAKTRDFQAIARFAAAFMRRTGALPASRWYVVNQFREQDPERRQQLLAGAGEDIDGFAEDGGLAVDTRDLFELLRRVDDQTLTPEGARTLLRGQTGRFSAPAS